MMVHQLSLFGKYIVYEYSFIISPDAPTKQQVKLRKEKINGIIGLPAKKLYSPAHISLLKINRNADFERSLIERTDKALGEIKKFNIRLNGLMDFHHGPDGRSLVLSIEDIEPVRTIFQTLLHAFNQKTRKILPHLTIARSISVKDYNKINPYLQELEYKGEFICDRITILKKRADAPLDEKYTMCHESLLKAVPLNSTPE